MPLVLLVDDEEALRVSLAFTLRKEGYEVTTAPDGATGLRLMYEKPPDVVLLDLMLPGLDGMEICRRIRAWSDVPILMLTAKDEVEDKVTGLRSGADDYITKPFSTRELVARIEAVLRRRGTVRAVGTGQPARQKTTHRSAQPADGTPAREASHGAASSGVRPAAPLVVRRSGILEGGPVRMDLDRHEVNINGERTDLSPKEYELLRALLSHQGRALSRDELIEGVWGEDFMGDAKTVDVHIRWLRAKVETDPGDPRHIVTVRGVGYRFDQ
jgi:two-component system, OmpR family, response regulator RegX3